MKLRTKRLLLRQIERKDIESLVRNINNLNVSRWLLVVPYPYRRKDAIWYINNCRKKAREKPRKDYNFAIELLEEKAVIGGISINKIDRYQKTATVEKIRKTVSRQPVFRSWHVPMIAGVVGSKETAGQTALPALGPDGLRQLRVFAFSGLADNRNFRDSMTEMGCQLVGFSGFSDHHHYTDRDLAGILQSARESGAEAMATTEKDFTKIVGRINWPLNLVVIGVQAAFGEEEGAFRDFIQDRLN